MDKLTSKTYRQYDYMSRYSGFPFYYNVEDDKYIYGTTANLRDDISYTLYEVKKTDTYDSIALDFYNTPLYFWVICDYNRIQDPLEHPIPGTKLKIPSITSLSFKDN